MRSPNTLELSHLVHEEHIRRLRSYAGTARTWKFIAQNTSNPASKPRTLNDEHDEHPSKNYFRRRVRLNCKGAI